MGEMLGEITKEPTREGSVVLLEPEEWSSPQSPLGEIGVTDCGAKSTSCIGVDGAAKMTPLPAAAAAGVAYNATSNAVGIMDGRRVEVENPVVIPPAAASPPLTRADDDDSMYFFWW